MEREDKPKKVVKEKRSVKKSKKSTASGEAGSVPAEAAEARRADSGSANDAGRKQIEIPGIEEIQLRAYFIGERRMTLGIPGDATSDWVQAERELEQEAGLK
jgi:hypothetical protein